ncbi:unnamed protein product [Paramecium primaurelia]|uniref:Transmembrane protein n=1 Tax=Paramecium primaurelia TaxID=5886 RepID=A0A8S1PRM8_PARPR|nr:unnamed protein product [Paramecium primaurelia]
MITSTRSNETICLPYKRYQRALPFKINQIIENDSKQITVEHYRLQILSNLHGISSISKFLFIHKFKDDKMILAIIEGSTVMKLLFFQNNQAIKIYKFLLFANLIDIFFNRQAMLITIVYQQSIEIYEIKFDDIQKRIYQTGIMIIKAMQLNFIVYYLLEDCNKVGIKLFQNKFDFEQTKYLFDCKTSLQFIKDDVYINNYTIQFKFKSSYIHKLTLKEQVIEVRNVLADYLLLFTCYHNQQYVKLYRVYQDELFKLYTLPTYNYSILFPFQYRIQKSIVMIKAQSLNQSFYILIYDILQTAVESLISITQIDEEERYQFDFANENEYYFQFQEQFYIQKLDQPCFLLNLSQDSFDFIQDKPLKITTYSQISNQNIDLEFHLININKNYRLQQLNLNQSILKGNIIKIENIFGNIETVEIVGTDNIQVILPLIFNNYSVICEYYRFGICVNRSQIIRNIFGQSTSILYSQDIKSKVYYIGYNPDDSNHAIYTQENGALIISQFNFSDQNQILLQKYKILNKTDQFINFKQIYDLQIFRYLKDLYFIMFQNKPIFNQNLIDTFQFVQFDLLDGIKINNFTYLIFNIKQMQFELIFINFTKIEDDVYFANIFFNKSYELNNLFPNISPSFHQVDFMLIQIYQTIKNNNQIEIKFIVFLKYHLALLMRMILDLNNLDQIQFEQQGIIRYEKDVSFKQSLFIDNNHIILAFELDQNIFINVFDISILSKTKNIDSIQKLKDNNYTAIERYNTTHFVVVERIKEYYHQVHLLTIDKLRLQCQQQCTKTAYLKLSNNVSQIVIEINFSTEKDINLVSLQLIILITNFIYIFIRLYCKQKRKCR